MATIVIHPTHRDASRRTGVSPRASGRVQSMAVAVAMPVLFGLSLWGMADAVAFTHHALLGFAVQPVVSA